jgi:hypothetical protein
MNNNPGFVPHYIDGPMVYSSDGQMHWLTLWERIQWRLGLTDAEKLQPKLRPRLTAAPSSQSHLTPDQILPPERG